MGPSSFVDENRIYVCYQGNVVTPHMVQILGLPANVNGLTNGGIFLAHYPSALHRILN